MKVFYSENAKTVGRSVSANTDRFSLERRLAVTSARKSHSLSAVVTPARLFASSRSMTTPWSQPASTTTPGPWSPASTSCWPKLWRNTESRPAMNSWRVSRARPDTGTLAKVSTPRRRRRRGSVSSRAISILFCSLSGKLSPSWFWRERPQKLRRCEGAGAAPAARLWRVSCCFDI